jgi:cytochrome b subunit of formate dehydrogenase
MSNQTNTAPAPVQVPKRFSVLQRIEHIVLVVSFTTLGLTGLAQKFSSNEIAAAIIQLLGGIENVRIIHRVAATILALETIYHIIVLAYKTYVRRTELGMLPGPKDALDALDVLRYNLGLTKAHPKLPRYNFAEKAEYWAMLWGTAVMGLTGFILWNPIVAAKILPGQFIPAAKAAHGGEAVLAVLAILVWHFYNVHLKSLNKAMFTGKMTPHQMEEEHGEELERLAAGKVRPAPSPEGMRRRERIFIPFAVIATLVMVYVVFWAVTVESTAVATAPSRSNAAPVFVPVTASPSPMPSATPEGGSIGVPIPHPIAGQEQCLTCHAAGGLKPVPANHDGRPVESCQICHKPGPTPTPGGASETGSGAAPAIPHAIDGAMYQDCTTCHGADKLKPFPANHASFAVDSCTACHKPAAAGATPEPGATSQASETPAAGGPKPIPHPIEGDAYKDCTTCHGADKMKPFPANHASFAADSCTTCHQPAAADSGTASTAAAAKTIPHPIAGDAYKDCTFCHGADKIKPFPANHAAFAADSCTTCHQPAAAPAAAEATPEPAPTAEE